MAHGGHGHGHHGGRSRAPYYDGDDIDFEVMETFELAPDADTVLGAIDVAAYEHQMNALKQVPVSVARILVRSGSAAITNAIATAKQPWYKPNLPGETERNNVMWKLKWHDDALAKLTDGNAMYGSGDDLKKWVLAAYLDANAAEEGAAWIAPMWTQMWTEIGAAIAALPKAIAEKVNETAGALLGMPIWVIVLSGIGVLGVGVAVYAKARAAR